MLVLSILALVFSGLAFLSVFFGGWLILQHCRQVMNQGRESLQVILNDMAVEQNNILNEIAKEQAKALGEILEAQSLVNQSYKKHIEELTIIQEKHTEILNFTRDIPFDKDDIIEKAMKIEEAY